MTLFSLVLATIVPVAIALAVALWHRRAQADFFQGLIAAGGNAPREGPPLPRLGLGLDEAMVSWRDWRPAERARDTPLDDPTLEAARLHVRFAYRVSMASLPVVVAVALMAATLLSTVWLVPFLGALAAWGFGQGAAGAPGLAYSRPELGQEDDVVLLGYLLPVAIVAGTLLLAGLIIAVAQAAGA